MFNFMLFYINIILRRTIVTRQRGNGKAVECHSSLDKNMACNGIQITLDAVTITIDNWAIRKIKIRSYTIDCRFVEYKLRSC